MHFYMLLCYLDFLLLYFAVCYFTNFELYYLFKILFKLKPKNVNLIHAIISCFDAVFEKYVVVIMN